jgi:hypothetical protein
MYTLQTKSSFSRRLLLNATTRTRTLNHPDFMLFERESERSYCCAEYYQFRSNFLSKDNVVPWCPRIASNVAAVALHIVMVKDSARMFLETGCNMYMQTITESGTCQGVRPLCQSGAL